MNRKVVLCVVLMLFLAETSLLSADLQRAQLATRANVNPTLNDSNFASSYDNVTIHEGDLVINGTQTFVIENCTYIQTGNIYVRDAANLVIRYAEFVIEERYSGELGITVNDNATMSIENASLSATAAGMTPGGFEIDIYDNARGSISSDILDCWVYSYDKSMLSIFDTNATNNIGVYEPSRFSSSNSTINEFELIFTEGSMEISDAHPGFFTYWSLQNLTGVGGEFNATLVNTTVTYWDMDFRGSPTALISNSTIYYLPISNFANVTIVNSTIGTLVPGLYEWNETLSLVNIRPGLFDHWSLKENSTSSNVDFDITIVDSEIGCWRLEPGNNGRMNITQSDIAVLTPFGQSTTSVANSTIGAIWSDDGSPFVSLSDSIISSIQLQSPSTTLSISNSSVTRRLCCWNNSTVYVAGQVDFGGMQPYGIFLYDSSKLVLTNASVRIFGNMTLWDLNAIEVTNSTVTRNFACITQTKGNYPIANVTQALYDENNVTIWKGTSNSSGTTGFSLVFTDSNYTGTLRLAATIGNLSVATNVSFLSGTPIVLIPSFSIPGDLDGDWKVSLADLVILAQAYGSKPGDSNWNPNADINGSGIVDLADLVILAQHYGQHYP